MTDEQISEDEFNPTKAMEELAALRPPHYGRKLTLSEKCGIAYALAKGVVAAQDVREAFGLSRATVSLLAHALTTGKRYQDVRNAYEKMGENAFKTTYYTSELNFRLRRIAIKRQHPEITKIPGDEFDTAAKPFGSDINAAKYAYENFGPVLIDQAPDEAWRIDWLTIENTHGWFFRSCDPNLPHEPRGAPHGQEFLEGANDPHPFRLSANAYDGVWSSNGLESPRPKPGRKP